ncbi:MAG: helicase-related protein [Synechocystis sp.]
MARDYFQHDGELCPRFQQRLQDGDRLLAARLEEFWCSRFPAINVHHYLQDHAFINSSRQFLSLHTPLKDKMFRHTRETLREYYRRGLLERDIPTRQVHDQAIALEPTREAELYRQVSDYVRDFYRLAQTEERKALGFLMTLYRKRLTSSFYAIQASLQRRLEALLTQQGNGLTEDDYQELDEQEDAVIDGLNHFFEPVHPQEIEYLEEMLRQFENTGEDTKFSHLLTTLRHEFQHRDSVIIFTQYTDTLDFLREELRQVYGAQIACYSGRGGEKWQVDQWHTVPKEQIKREFRQGDIQILLCTESASEGLNLQTCGVLINYDLPWNPMRVEQRIGRIDRIGQTYPQVTIHNFYYDGTVEAKVYQRLRERIENFSSVVGGLQPILARIPTLIEQATMSADPQEEDVLFAAFDHDLADPPLKVTLDSMLQMDVEADIASLRQPQPPSPITQADMEQWLTTSHTLHQAQIQWQKMSEDTWHLHHPDHPTPHTVTFDPQRFEENPDLQLMAIGNRIFEAIVSTVVAEQTTPQQSETKSPLGSG